MAINNDEDDTHLKMVGVESYSIFSSAWKSEFNLGFNHSTYHTNGDGGVISDDDDEDEQYPRAVNYLKLV